MRHRSRAFHAWLALLACCAVLCGLAPPAGAQIALPRPAAAASAAPAPQARDPLERETPRGAVAGFIRAAHRGDFAVAVRYGQFSKRQQPEAEELLRDFNELLNRYFQQPLASLSDSPEGALDDGLAPERERVGPLRIGGEEHYIELVRVQEAGSDPVWLISSETLARVPQLHTKLQPRWLQGFLPDTLWEHGLFGLSLASLFLWGASIALPLLLFHAVLAVVHAVLAKATPDAARRLTLARWYAKARWPLALALALLLHFLAVSSFAVSLSSRIVYGRAVLVLLVAALAWGAQRLLALVFEHSRARMAGPGRTGARSLMLMGERILKVAILLVALLVALYLCGLDIRAALAGLGIVGFAVALGAKQTVENILGGVMLLGDKAFAVGDECRVSGRDGIVEDITLRSVRIRTREQTLLSIPAGVLAAASIENYQSRGKHLAENVFRLSHRTTAAQLRAVRDGIEALIRGDARIEQDSARIRLTGVGIQGFELELVAYYLTPARADFLAAREQLLLQIVAAVEAQGCEFAAPPGTPPATPPTAASPATAA